MSIETVRIEDIMTSDLDTVTPETPVTDAIRLLASNRHSALPVVDKRNRLLGTFTEQHSFGWIRRQPEPDNVTDLTAKVMASPPRPVLTPLTSVFNAMNMLLDAHATSICVIDESSRVVGVFSEMSALKAFTAVCWDQMPDSSVEPWMDCDPRRFVSRFTSLSEVLSLFENNRFRRLVVLNDGGYAGQIARTDVLRTLLISHAGFDSAVPTTGDTCLTQQPAIQTISPYSDAMGALHVFARTGVRRIAVIHEDCLVGQVSRCDVLRALELYFPSINPELTRVKE